MAKLDSQRVKVRVAKRGRDDTPSSGLQGRGLIYIDTDDDVTSIVGKIKAAKETVVALVPPKRIGVLQSAVNLSYYSEQLSWRISVSVSLPWIRR